MSLSLFLSACAWRGLLFNYVSLWRHIPPLLPPSVDRKRLRPRRPREECQREGRRRRQVTVFVGEGRWCGGVKKGQRGRRTEAPIWFGTRERWEINIGREIHESLLPQKRMFTRGGRPIVSLGDVCVVTVHRHDGGPYVKYGQLNTESQSVRCFKRGYEDRCSPPWPAVRVRPPPRHRSGSLTHPSECVFNAVRHT